MKPIPALQTPGPVDYNYGGRRPTWHTERPGRRRVFVWGLGAFTFASLLCGLAPTAGVQLNYALHMVAVRQARSDARGGVFYRKKIEEGKYPDGRIACVLAQRRLTMSS